MLNILILEQMLDDDENNKFLKKINIPAVIMCTQTFIRYRDKNMITEDQFTKFLSNWVDVNAECSGYIANCGQGSTGKTKVKNRINIINEWLKNYICDLNNIDDIKEETDNGNEYCAEENIGA